MRRRRPEWRRWGLGASLEDSQASKREREDTGWVGGAGRLEVLAELETGEGEALVVGRHGGLEAGEGHEHVASPCDVAALPPAHTALAQARRQPRASVHRWGLGIAPW
jgi:hypothetical protein